jgi:hypothetical protein
MENAVIVSAPPTSMRDGGGQGQAAIIRDGANG